MSGHALSGNVQTFVICLEREEARGRAALEQIRGRSIDATLFIGTDGRSLSPADREDVDQRAAVATIGRELVAGEIGCFLSHRRLWREIAAKDLAAAVVLECDARVAPQHDAIVAELSRRRFEWDIVMLQHRKCVPSFWHRHTLNGEARAVKFANRRSFHTSGYLLTARAARRLDELAVRITMPVDHFVSGGRVEKGLEMYAVLPRCVEHGPTHLDSSIAAERRAIAGGVAREHRERGVARRLWRHLRYLPRRLRRPPASL